MARDSNRDSQINGVSQMYGFAKNNPRISRPIAKSDVPGNVIAKTGDAP